MTTDPSRAAAAPAAAAAPSPTAEVVLREQRLSVDTVRVATERVVLRRRVVSEVRQVQVTVQREELEVRRVPVDPDREQDTGTRGAAGPPLVIVLSEQVPVVQLQTRAYETITVTVDVVTGQQEVHEQAAREHAEVTQEPADRTTGS